MNIWVIGYEDVNWIALVQDCALWWTLVLALLNFLVSITSGLVS